MIHAATDAEVLNGKLWAPTERVRRSALPDGSRVLEQRWVCLDDPMEDYMWRLIEEEVEAEES